MECKNFGSEIGNPELDQLAMRLSSTRGMFGILFCRSIEDSSKLLDSCKAILADDRKYLVVIDDSDLEALVLEVKNEFPVTSCFSRLKERFKNLAFGAQS